MSKIIVIGNPADGFTFVGPFDDAETANDYADVSVNRCVDWWCIELRDPEEWGS